MKRLLSILPHITIILSAMFLVFLILDQYNPMMNFINSDASKTLLLLFCVSSMSTAIILIILDRKIKR